MSAANWVTVDFKDVKLPEKHTRDGLSISVLPSPYNVPIGIRLIETDQHGNSSVDMKYLSDEPVREASLADRARVVYGKNSYRIYRVQVPASQGEPADLIGKFQRALNSYVTLYRENGDVDRNARLCALAIRKLVGAHMASG